MRLESPISNTKKNDYDAEKQKKEQIERKSKLGKGYLDISDKSESKSSGSSYTPTSSQEKSSYSPTTTQDKSSTQLSSADSSLMSERDKNLIGYFKDRYASASTDEERARWHDEAEKVRSEYGYSGGADGSGYTSTRDSRTPSNNAQPEQNAPANQQEMESTVQNVGSTMESFRTIGQQFASQSAEHAAAVAAQYTQMVEMLNNLESQVLGQIRSQMGGDDPGLKSAIGLIRQEAERMRDATLEDLNARGLVQSGVYAEMLDRLNSNELTQVQQVVGQRFGDLQNQLNQAVMSMAQMRMGALSQHQNNLNSMMTQDRNTMAQIGMQGAQAGLTERGQNLQNNQYYAGLDQQYDIAKMNDATQRYGVDKSYDASIYGADKSYDASIYGTDKQYNASIYSANKSYSASALANQNAGEEFDYKKNMYELERDQFNYTKEQQEDIVINEQMAKAKNDLSAINKEISNGRVTGEQAIALVEQGNWHPDVKQWLETAIRTYNPTQFNQGNTGGAGKLQDPWNQPRASYESYSPSWQGKMRFTP